MRFEKCLNNTKLNKRLSVMQDTQIAGFVTQFLSTKLILKHAKNLGIITRRRKVKLVALVYCLCFATVCSPNRSIADWHRFYCIYGPKPIAYSSFYARLTPALGRLFELILTDLLRKQRPKLSHWLESYLYDFKHIFAIDSSTIQLRKCLRDTYQACTNDGSALKLHSIINVLSLQMHSFKVTGQTNHDICGLSRLGQWCCGKLLLMEKESENSDFLL